MLLAMPLAAANAHAPVVLAQFHDSVEPVEILAVNDDFTAIPRDDETARAFADHGRLPTCEEQDWPAKPVWPGRDRWRSWD